MHRGAVASYPSPGILYETGLLTVLPGDDIKKWTPIGRSRARVPGHAFKRAGLGIRWKFGAGTGPFSQSRRYKLIRSNFCN